MGMVSSMSFYSIILIPPPNDMHFNTVKVESLWLLLLILKNSDIEEESENYTRLRNGKLEVVGQGVNILLW